ncbi:MAG: enoyl-CoA hydratase/isomerase family protein [Pirellulales bacterium]
MPEPIVQVKVHGHVGTIVLNRPARRNAISRQMLADLLQAFEDLHAERKVRAVVLTGAGSAFCAGMDLGEMLATTKADNALAMWHHDAVAYRDVVEYMLRFPKPIIAAVNGPAVAGGAGFVLASDIVVASPTATFGLPEPLRGLVAGLVAPLLAFRVGGGLSAYLLLTAEILPADEAKSRGIYHEVVATDLVWARAAEIAKQCARCAPEALQLTKKMLNETIGEHLTTLLAAGAAASATARTTEAAAEGLAAFLEKREPNWP